jgi:hypothetical protein
MTVWRLVVPRRETAHQASGSLVARSGYGRFMLGCALLLSAACGTPPAPRTSSSPVQTSGPLTTANPSPAATYSPTYPGLDRFSDPIDRLSYKLAFADCRTLGLNELSMSYGGDPSDPASVARRYAAAANPSRAAAATQGCLGALRQPPHG